jgi:hypothetical protein
VNLEHPLLSLVIVTIKRKVSHLICCNVMNSFACSSGSHGVVVPVIVAE